ncbi:MAG: DNA alkylation repair protein, partial [Methylocystaceae bacterium]
AVGIIPQVKQTEDATIYLNFIRPLMMDNAREVQQGTGWMLRETWKQHPEQTEAFLLEYKDVSPRLIFQYATEKMCKEDKARFKANKNK